MIIMGEENKLEFKRDGEVIYLPYYMASVI